MSGKKFAQDYTQMCRTCLQSNVEMINLSAFINDNIKEETAKISYMDCLKKWIKVEETEDAEMPQRICLECASALQVAYWFTKNASQAHELLKIKLEEIRRKTLQIEKETPGEDKKPKRYRCKICNVKVETKRSLKDHIKLHLDIIVYNCQMCTYESHSRNSLSDHYIQIHCVEATKEQLKPRTKLSSTSNLTSSNITASDQTDSDTQQQYFQVLAEDSQQIFCQNFANPSSTNDSSYSTYTSISAPFDALEGELNTDIKLANEFMVMADGSLEKVLNKGVVIEYINTQNNDSDLKLENGSVLDNIIQVQGMDNTVMLGQQNIGQMDIDDLIIEDPCDAIEELDGNVILPLDEETIPATFIEQPKKKIMCKICTKDFLTQEQLKNHMLTHNEIPHFFCDQCTFYTFFKIDLHQHYKSKHNLQPTNKQLQPKNKQKTIDGLYACDFCLYEADEQADIKKHYIIKHNLNSETHSKPPKAEKLKSKLSVTSAKNKTFNKTTTSTSKNFRVRSIEPSTPTPDYPNGLNCRKCHKLFFWRNKLYEHYKLHNAEEAVNKQEKQLAKIQSKTTFTNPYQNKTKNIKTTPVQTSKVAHGQFETKKSNFSTLGSLNLNVFTPNVSTHNPVAPPTPSTSSTYTLPSDAIPQIVETDQTIENMDFEFNCDDDALFGDFDVDVDVENDPDENDSEFRNVLLTSDDDLEEMLADQNDVNENSANATVTGSYCAHCQKSFLSQYQFENHMFVHRGLAPYRCEMCTNIYNTKRCLIRHYRAVHKNVPTRDMIQAKGDKVCDDKSLVEDLKIEATTCLMCAKCPYESSELENIKFHLKSSHNIIDESYIMKKQPFECPRCIRSFSSKMKLFRHLDRNHSLTPINQQHPFHSMKNTSEIAANTSFNAANNINMIKTENSGTSASCGYNEQQQQDAVTSHTSITTLFEEIICPTTQHMNSVINMHSFPTALDGNDIDQPLFKCKICFLTCYNLSTFNEHSKRIECREVNNVHSSSDKMLFECEICHCNYKSMYLLKHHLKRHIGRKFLCANCPKTYINKVELEAHKHVHSGERPHKCDVCTKSFRYIHHLKRHKDSVHFGKRYTCTEANCGSKFTTLAQLKVHIWTHNGIAPYKCPFCNRLFKKRLLLREHCMKIHKKIMSEEEMAKVFRNSLGYTNPHDFTVAIGNGKMLRRRDLETMAASGIIQSSFQ